MNILQFVFLYSKACGIIPPFSVFVYTISTSRCMIVLNIVYRTDRLLYILAKGCAGTGFDLVNFHFLERFFKKRDGTGPGGRVCDSTST